MVVMSPSGDIAAQQRDLIVISTVLMLLIIVPVIALTLLFAWRYRESNKEATYDPDWHHSTQLEVVIWAAPLVIIIALGAVTWSSTHLLDPYRPLSRVAEGRPLPEGVKPLQVQAVALDWKWLFIYPELGVATVNELAAPVDRPINFQITSSTVMNSFFIPALAGQIYAMAGMETKLHAVINTAGVYDGFSANYSGAGFSDMRFKFHGVSEEEFGAWVAKAKASGATLDRATYTALEKPSVREPVKLFASVDGGLYDAILNMCVDTAKMCMKDMMRIDAQGGLGKEGIRNVFALQYDAPRSRGGHHAPPKRFVAAACTPEAPRDGLTVERAAPKPAYERRADAVRVAPLQTAAADAAASAALSE
ncbi:ubiquinol oxidase subunit II [Methylopila jiangsuensis]|nr:ubiquinol oxidase subunit II [Methylopila jiangsuensis]